MPSSQALPGFLIHPPPSVCVPAVIGALAVWIQNQNKNKNTYNHAVRALLCAIVHVPQTQPATQIDVTKDQRHKGLSVRVSFPYLSAPCPHLRVPFERACLAHACTCLAHACECMLFVRVCHTCFPCTMSTLVFRCGATFHWRECSRESPRTNANTRHSWRQYWLFINRVIRPKILRLSVHALLIDTCNLLCCISACFILSFFHNMIGLHTYTHTSIQTQ